MPTINGLHRPRTAWRVLAAAVLLGSGVAREAHADDLPCPCLGDVNHDCLVNQVDLGLLLAAWGTKAGDVDFNADADFDGDGFIHQSDLGTLLPNWGGCALPQAPVYEPGGTSRPPAAPTGCPSPGGGESGCGCATCGKSHVDGAGDVHGFNGEFAPAFSDLAIDGVCMPFAHARRYRSRAGGDTTQGQRWDHSYNIGLTADPNDPNSPNLAVCDGNGRCDVYVRRSPSLWARNEYFNTLESNGDGTYTLHFPHNGHWNFLPPDDARAPGKISSMADRNGNQISFAYDAQGRLETVTDTLGRAVVYGYDGDGRLSAVTDYAGRTVQYAYDSEGNLVSATTPPVTGTPQGNDFPLGKTTVYTYTTGFSDDRLNHQMLTITDPRGETWLSNTYAHTIDPNDPRHTTDPNSVYFGRLVRQTLGGGVIDFVYQIIPAQPGNGYATRRTIVNDRVGNVSEYFYDALNRLVVERRHTGRWPADEPTYDTTSPPFPKLRAGDPDYFETRYDYNSDSQAVRVIHPNGNEERYTYDSGNANRHSQGNLIEHCRLPGPLGGDQAQICEQYTYVADLGGCCGANFVKTHTDARGNVTTYEYDASGNRTQAMGRIPSIVDDYEYNAAGQLTAHVLPDNGGGHRRRDELYYYDSGPQTGYLRQSVVDAGGFALTTTYEYDALGNMLRMIDPRGHDTRYEYNALDQVVRERSREVTPGGARHETLYFYDGNDNRVRVDVENRDEAGTLQSNTHFTTIYEYDALNQVVRSAAESGSYSGVIPGTHDQPTADGLPQSEFSVTRYVYDGNRNRILTLSGEAVNGQQPANTASSVYDERDLLFRSARGAGDPNDPNHPPDAGLTTVQYDYDANGNLVRSLQGLEDAPRVTQYEYDGYDRQARVIDAMGNVTETQYDANGNRVRRLSAGELTDGPGGAGNQRLEETDYVYDAQDRLVRTDRHFFDTVTQAPLLDGLSTSTTVYADTSQPLSVTNDNGHAAATVYDTANRVHMTVDAAGNTVVTTYDENSNVTVIRETDRSDIGSPDQEFATTYTYDGLDRRIRSVDAVGSATEYFYDSRGNQTSMIDALGHEVRYFYDGASRLVTTVRDMNNGGADPNDPNDIVTRQTWDDNSRLTGQIDDSGNLTTYVYDALDRRVSEFYADGTAIVHAYDVHSNRIATQDANGSLTACVYDGLDRLTSRTIAPGPGVSNATTFEVYQYDGLSRLVQAQDDDSLVVRGYDSLSHMTGEALNGGTTTCVHDGVGNRLSCTYPGGRQVLTTYDVLERMKTISDGVTGVIATYDYIGPTRVERRDYGNGTRLEYTYDGIEGVPNPPSDFGVRRVIRTRHTRISDGAVIDDRTYTWDRMGNKTQRKDVRAGGPQYTHDYEYDQAYRLVRTVVTDPNSVVMRDEQYDLDGVGNRVQVTGGLDPGLYTMDPLLPEPGDFQLNQYTTTSFDAREYDKNGNLVRIDFGLPTQRDILYDYRNQMVAHIDAGNDSSYRYDALGRRIEKSVDPVGPDPAVITRFFLSGWQEIEEQDELGTTRATYIYGLYVDEVLNMRR